MKEKRDSCRLPAYLSSFWKVWSPSSRSLKRKRGGSGGTSLSCCSILRLEMSKTTPLWSERDASAGKALEEGEKKSSGGEGGDVRGSGAAGERRVHEEREQ